MLQGWGEIPPQPQTLQVGILPFPFDFAGHTECLLKCSQPLKGKGELPGPVRSPMSIPLQNEACLPHAHPWLFEPAHSTSRLFHPTLQPGAIPENTVSAVVIICSHLQFCTHKTAYKSQPGWRSIQTSAEGLQWWGFP